MESNTNKIAFAYFTPRLQVDPITDPEPEVEASKETKRRPVDGTDIQLFNTVLNAVAIVSTEEINEEATTYKSVIEDQTRQDANVFLRDMIKRFSDEIKARG